jgi:hypothetical protein
MLMRLTAAGRFWIAYCLLVVVILLSVSCEPYQCQTDMECELLTGQPIDMGTDQYPF